MSRAIYLANVLGVDMGMYYKRLDYSKYVNGRHPIAAYEFLGPKIEGKDMILIDDMISSGDTILKIASLLKKKGAGKVYICSTFGFFTDGLDKFDDAYKKATSTNSSLPTWFTRHRSFLRSHTTSAVI